MKLLKKIKSCKFFFSKLIIVFILFNLGNLFAQTGVGGTKSIFFGVGARSLSLGNAFVARADDPTAVFYNPAGLDYIEKKSASFYYTTLIESSQYNFVGFVYPTQTIGSFGFGWIRIGTGDLLARDVNANPGESFGYSQNQFIFSYAKQLKKFISLGASFKIEVLNFSLQNLSDSGAGIDFGALYRPDLDNAILRDIALGFNVQNLVNPKTRLVDVSEAAPLNFKLGLEKPLKFGDGQNAVNILFDLNKSESAPAMFNIGAEYTFHNQAMVRIGWNDGLIAFGVGAAYNNFHLDYSFGKMFDGVDFSANHRFSITIEFGKSKTELIRLAQERREKAILLRVENELWFKRETEFNSNMEEGRDKYYNGDFLGAYVDFSSAYDAATALVETAMRLRGENMHDPEANMRVETANSSMQEAQTMLELANAKSDSARIEEIRKIASQATQSKLEQELRDFVVNHREKGNEFFKNGYFSRALSEWQLALDRINQNEGDNLPSWVDEVRVQLKNNIRMAEKKLAGNVKEAIKLADALARRGKYVQALEELNKVRGSGVSETERASINAKIRSIQSQLTFKQNYDEGVAKYNRKEWQAAMQAFQRALKTNPRNAKARKYFEDAKARSLATVKVMPPNLRVRYLRGVEFFRQGKYREALQIWEQINEEQPYNKTILDSIDRARERLNNKN